MKWVMACLVLAVAVAGCGGGDSVDCGPLVLQYEGVAIEREIQGEELAIELELLVADIEETIEFWEDLLDETSGFDARMRRNADLNEAKALGAAELEAFIARSELVLGGFDDDLLMIETSVRAAGCSEALEQSTYFGKD